MFVESVIKREARKDADADIWHGRDWRGPGERSKAAILRALATEFGWCNSDDWLSMPIPGHARSSAYEAYRVAYDRRVAEVANNSRLAASIVDRGLMLSEEQGTAIERLKAAARKDACESHLLGLCGPASIPWSDASRRAIRDAVASGCAYSADEIEAIEPFTPGKDEMALRVYQRAYNEHMQGLR